MFSGRIGAIVCGLLALSGAVLAQGKPPPKAPLLRAAAAIVVDARTGRSLFEKNPDTRLPPASTTKILTGLLLARDVPPQTRITTSPAAAVTPGSALGMKPGETFSARDLLHAVLLESANDASVAAAEHIAGTEAQFVARMNAEAQTMGAKNTRFVNSHGLTHPEHLSTARDLAAITRAALRNPDFDAVARARTYRIPRGQGQPPTALTNKNLLLWTVPGADGVKTGWTRAAGYCFVGSATQGHNRIITVVLNSPDWQGETAALMRYGLACLPADNTPGRNAAAFPPRQAGQRPATGTSQRPLSGNNPSRERDDSPVRSTGPGQTQPHPVAGAARSYGKPLANAGGGLEAGPPDADVPDALLGAALPAGSPVGSPFRTEKPSLPGAKTAFPGARGAERGDLAAPARMQRSPASGDSGAPGLLSALTNRLRGSESPPSTTDRPNHASGAGARTAAQRPQAGKRYPQASRVAVLTPPKRDIPWRLLVWLLLLLYLLFALLWRLSSRRSFPMNLSRLFPAFRRSQSPASVKPEGGLVRHTVKRPTAPAPPNDFQFAPPALTRRRGEEWLKELLEAPARLLEPAARRQARALLDANPCLRTEAVLALLSAPSAQIRIAAAGLVASFSPLRAEETLLAALEEDLPADLRSDAMAELARSSGDRHEMLWTQMLTRDGSPLAANALATLPTLDETTRQMLQRVVEVDYPVGKPMPPDLRGHQLAAHVACVLGAHGLLEPSGVRAHLERLPSNHRESVLVGSLRGVSTPWAVERLLDIALYGHAYPALQALMECDPALVREALEPYVAKPNPATRTRALALKWLLLGEGGTETLRQLADAGDDLSRGALSLGQLYRYDPQLAPPDALLAAAQILSLRLGYSHYPQESVAAAFRTAASGAEGLAALAEAPELEPLARAYTHPAVYDAVQAGLHTEDGQSAILAGLARAPRKPGYEEELAFWCDKLPRESRLLLTQALYDSESEAARSATAARATDPCAPVRAAALRSLRAHPAAPIAEAAPELTPAGIAKRPAEEIDRAA